MEIGRREVLDHGAFRDFDQGARADRRLIGPNLPAPSIFIIDKLGRLVWENIEAGPYHRIPADRVIEALESSVGTTG
jgi:hypothetical protein